MKKIIIILIILLFASTNIVFASHDGEEAGIDESILDEARYVNGEILVKFKKRDIDLEKKFTIAQVEDFAYSKNWKQKDYLNEENIALLESNEDESYEEMREKLKDNPDIEFIQPNFIYRPLLKTNDPKGNELWGIENFGQNVNSVVGKNDADIDAPEAWALANGKLNDVIVAVLDSGVDHDHPDLINNMWDGRNCVDENKRYLGNCKHGYDFEGNDRDPMPGSIWHGTHIAGTIAATINNSKGVAGVAPNAKIMALKTSLRTSELIRAIKFAENNGAKIINASWGDIYFNGSYDHFFLDQALKNAISSFDGLFIAAAGNDLQNMDTGNSGKILYPAGFTLSNIISVGATDQNDNLAWWSNYGRISVDVAAPGTNIYSTLSDPVSTNERYGFSDGTSMAAPHVVGVAALIWGIKPSLSRREVKNIIMSTGDTKSALNGKTVSGKRVNAFNAISSISGEPVVRGIDNEPEVVKGPSLAGLPGAEVERISGEEAAVIISRKSFTSMNSTNQEIFNKITAGRSINSSQKNQLSYFIEAGTPTTKTLGSGERGGVVSSYYSAYNKFPLSHENWKDVIKIGNGRWPSERNSGKENAAAQEFKKVYKRNPNRSNANDDAAVTIVAYGLRPAIRNLGSERAAGSSFKQIYGRGASSATDWDIVRAVAYSGARR